MIHPFRRHQIAHHEQVKLLAKRQEVREERVEVRLDGQVEYLLKVRVVQVRKDPEKVFVYVLGGVRERRWEITTWCASGR